MVLLIVLPICIYGLCHDSCHCLTHEVPAKPISITLVARTEYAAPILALANSVYEVKGTIEITPGPKKQYFVRGTLGEDYSAVWLEEAYTGVQIGQKIEVRGNAKLGFLEK